MFMKLVFHILLLNCSFATWTNKSCSCFWLTIMSKVALAFVYTTFVVSLCCVWPKNDTKSDLTVLLYCNLILKCNTQYIQIKEKIVFLLVVYKFIMNDFPFLQYLPSAGATLFFFSLEPFKVSGLPFQVYQVMKKRSYYLFHFIVLVI